MTLQIDATFAQATAVIEIASRPDLSLAQRSREVVEALRRVWCLHPEATRLIGAWQRRTMLPPVSEGIVDLLVIMDYRVHQIWHSDLRLPELLDRYATILAAAFPNTVHESGRYGSVLRFPDFQLSVRPAFRYDDACYSIPDVLRQRWLRIDPQASAAAIAAIDTALAGRFVPLIRLVRAWNRHQTGLLHGFHLESLMVHHAHAVPLATMLESCVAVVGGAAYPLLLESFFSALPDYLANPCYDPHSLERLDRYLDHSTTAHPGTNWRSIAIAQATAAAQAAHLAVHLELSDQRAAVVQWRTILGPIVPPPT